MTIPLSEVLDHVGAFFTGGSPIHAAAERIASALDEMGIPFVVVGALAANAHGHVQLKKQMHITKISLGSIIFRLSLRY